MVETLAAAMAAGSWTEWSELPEGGVRARPATAAELGRLVSLAHRHGARVVVDSDGATTGEASTLRVELSRLSRVDRPDRRGARVRVEAGATVRTVEAMAAEEGLTLGPLSPSVLEGSVGAWLAGPLAGRRTALSGAQESAVLGLESVLADGHRWLTREAPRAGGLPLESLLLGGGGRVGWVTAATLRLLPLLEPEVRVARAAAGVREAVALARAAVHGGLGPQSFQWVRALGRLEACFAGSDAQARAAAFAVGPSVASAAAVAAAFPVAGHLELSGPWRAWERISPLRPQALCLIGPHGDGAVGLLELQEAVHAPEAVAHARHMGLTVVAPTSLRAHATRAMPEGLLSSVAEALVAQGRR